MKRLWVLLLVLPAAHAEGWPFGQRRSGFNRLDLYNLGLIGAKAGDADRKPKANTPPSSPANQ